MIKEKLYPFVTKIIGIGRRLLGIKWLKRLLAGFVVCVLLLWGGAFALFHFYFYPRLDVYKLQAQTWFNEQTDGQLSIDKFDARWTGLAPVLTATNVKLSDEQSSHSPLHLKQVELAPSWRSLFTLSPRFSSIHINTPELAIVRNKENQWFLNNILINKGKTGKTGSGSANFWKILLNQGEIIVDQAQISFEDQYSDWPLLILHDGLLRYRKGFFTNELYLGGDLGKTGKHFVLDGRWQGDDVQKWRQWSGQVNFEIVSPNQMNFSQYLGKMIKTANIEGNAHGKLLFSKGALDNLTFSADFSQAQLTDNKGNQLVLPKIKAQAHIWQKAPKHYQFDVTDVDVLTSVGASFNRGALAGEIKLGEQGFGRLSMSHINLSALAPVLNLIGAHTHPVLSELDLKGSVYNLKSSWQGDTSAPHDFMVQSDFVDLSWNPIQHVPGVNKISGRVNYNKTSGEVQFSGKKVSLDLAKVYETPIVLEQITGQVHVGLLKHGLKVDVKELLIDNDDIKGLDVKGSYTHYFAAQPQKSDDSLELSIQAQQVNAQAVKKFLPRFMKPKSKAWLQNAFLAGSINNISASIKGNPVEFPFRAGMGGQFLAQADIKELELLFAPHWPAMQNVAGQVKFENENIFITAHTPSTQNLKIDQTKIVIRDLKDKENLWMDVDGNIQGELAQFLAYSRKTPIVRWTKGFIEEVRGTGAASMNLKMRMPLHHVRDAQVQADLKLKNNTVEFLKTTAIPKLQQASGILTFTENGLNAKGVRAQAFGGWVNMNAQVDKQRATHFRLNGRIDSQKLLSFYWRDAPVLLQGMSDYQSEFTLKKGMNSLSLTSNMNGSQWLLPVSGLKDKPLTLNLKSASKGWQIDVKLGQDNHARFMLQQGRLAHAAIGLGNPELPTSLTSREIYLQVKEPELDLEGFLASSNVGRQNNKGLTSMLSSLPVSFNVVTNKIRLAGAQYDQVTLKGRFIQQRYLDVNVISPQLNGKIQYDLSDRDKLTLYLSSFVLGGDTSDLAKEKNSLAAKNSLPGNKLCQQIVNLPRLMVQIDHFYLGKQNFGKLTFNGVPDGSSGYQINNLILKHLNTKITGELFIREQADKCTGIQGNIALNSDNFGTWLTQMGLSKQLEGGKARLTSDFSFPSVDNLALSNMEGQVNLQLDHGRFTNVQPGFGRILGIFDVGMLGKRLMFNFKDIFLPGLSFESINGTGKIRKGILATDDLRIHAAGIAGQMNGRVNLSEQTLNMKLSVSSNLTHGIASSIVDSIPINQNVLSAEQNIQPAGQRVDGAAQIKTPRQGGILTRNFSISGKWADPDVKRNQ